MELRQLEYFVAVVEEANFTRAAERVRVSQSGVSAQVRRLERELGQSLLDRSGRTVRATSAGAAILPYARAALAAVAGTRQAADDLAGLLRGRVAVGMVPACSVSELFDLLASFHQGAPGIELTLTEDSSDRLVDGIRTGRFDLALLGTAGTLPDGVASLVVADEALVAVVPNDHPLAAEPAVTLTRLLEHPLICMTQGSGVRAAFDGACAARGIRPRVALDASSPLVVAGLAQRRLGVAILTESMAAGQGALHAVAIVEPELRARLELVWRAGEPANPAAHALIRHARGELRRG